MFALKAVLLTVLVALVSCKPKPKHYLIETVSFLISLALVLRGCFILISEGGGGLNQSIFLKLVETTEKVNFFCMVKYSLILEFTWVSKGVVCVIVVSKKYYSQDNF